MNKLDFLSEPPQMLFFQKESNKTYFGGVLFIIFIIVVSILSIIHILDFCLNDKYEIYYSLIRNDGSEKDLQYDDEMDPLMNFSIDVWGVNEQLEIFEPNENFFIADLDFNYIKRNSTFQKRPSELFFYIIYFDFSYGSKENSTEDILNSWYYFQIKYQGFKLQHQKTIPLITNEPDLYFYKDYSFSINKTTINIINWEVIKYIENMGIYGIFDRMFKSKSEYISGYMGSDYTSSKDKPLDLFGMKFLSIVQIKNSFKQYTEYRRKKNSILDLIADIGSLFSTFFSIFVFIYKFYSSNIDNYQIIEKLLSNVKKMNILKRKETKGNLEINYININKNNKNQSDLTQVRMSTINDITKKDFDLSKANKEAEIIVQSKDKLGIAKIKTINEVKNIKRLSFRHFFMNGFYLKCFNRNNENKVIDLCNYILSKYNSVDQLLYNQIMFENLLEDYKWNNPDLGSISKNKLINRLININ